MERQLTADEMFELSKAFNTLSQLVGNYRREHRKEFTEEQDLELEKKQWELFNKASELNAQSVLIKTALIETDIATLKKATESMRSATKKIKDIKHAIAIATSALAFVGAVTLAASTGNVIALAPAALAVINEIGAS